MHSTLPSHYFSLPPPPPRTLFPSEAHLKILSTGIDLKAREDHYQIMTVQAVCCVLYHSVGLFLSMLISLARMRKKVGDKEEE